jgi:hypothetical protein
VNAGNDLRGQTVLQLYVQSRTRVLLCQAGISGIFVLLDMSNSAVARAGATGVDRSGLRCYCRGQSKNAIGCERNEYAPSRETKRAGGGESPVSSGRRMDSGAVSPTLNHWFRQ